MHQLIDVQHLQEASARIRAYADDAFELVADIIQSQLAIQEIVIPADAWARNVRAFAEYEYQCAVPLIGARNTDRVDLIIEPVCSDTAIACGFASFTDSTETGVQVFAKSVPDADIRATAYIAKYEVR